MVDIESFRKLSSCILKFVVIPVSHTIRFLRVKSVKPALYALLMAHVVHGMINILCVIFNIMTNNYLDLVSPSNINSLPSATVIIVVYWTWRPLKSSSRVV